MAPQQQRPQAGLSRFSALYRLLFLYIEPVSALASTFFAYFRQDEYLFLTYTTSAPPLGSILTGTSIVLS